MSPTVRLRALQVRHRWQRRLHWIVGAVGVATLCAGVAVLFTTDRDARSTFLLTLGPASWPPYHGWRASANPPACRVLAVVAFLQA